MDNKKINIFSIFKQYFIEYKQKKIIITEHISINISKEMHLK